MSDTEQLTQLKEMLSSNLIRKRKTGIKMASDMLANDLQRDKVRALLEEIAKNDSITIVRESAQKVLDADDAFRNSSPAKRPDYVFGAKCTKGHVNYYDKREYCPKSASVTRRVSFRDGRNVDEILIRCKTGGCGDEFYIEVDCEGYK